MENKKQIFINDIYYHILESKARVIINYGGRDSGKSYFTGEQYIPIAMINEPQFRGVCIRKTYNSLKDSVFTEVVDGIENIDMEHYFQYKISPMEIECSSGSKLLFRGLDDPKKLKSLKGINFILVEEAEDLTEEEFTDLLILLRGRGYQRIILNFNPIDEGHFTNQRFVLAKKDKIIERFADGDPKVWMIKVEDEINNKKVSYDVLTVCSTYEDNAFIPDVRKLVIEKLKDTNPFLYEVYRKGKFATKGGKILNNIEMIDFEEKRWFFMNFDSKGFAQDFGFSHANVTLSVAKQDDCLYVFDEIYQVQKDVNEIIDIHNEKHISKKIPMVCDSAEPDRIKTFKKAGFNARPVKKYAGSVKDQIMALQGYRKIYINSTCVNTWKEAKSWMYKTDRNGNYTDDPVDVFDDCMACLRYSKDLFSNKVLLVGAGGTEKRSSWR